MGALLQVHEGRKQRVVLTICTGLNAEYRPLRKLLKQCSVNVRRFKQAEIKRWMTPKPQLLINISKLYNISALHVQCLLQRHGMQIINLDIVRDELLACMQNSNATSGG